MFDELNEIYVFKIGKQFFLTFNTAFHVYMMRGLQKDAKIIFSRWPSVVFNSTNNLKICGCKRWCPKDLRVCANAAPMPMHSLCSIMVRNLFSGDVKVIFVHTINEIIPVFISLTYIPNYFFSPFQEGLQHLTLMLYSQAPI